MSTPIPIEKRGVGASLLFAFLFLLTPSWLQPAWATDFAAGAGAATLRITQIAALMPHGAASVDRAPGKDVANLTELFEPATDSRSVIGSLTVARTAHAPLQKGKVLLIGKVLNNGVVGFAELYNSVTDKWLEPGAISFGRAVRGMTLPRAAKTLVWVGIVVPF